MKLLMKMKTQFGIKGQLLKWITNFLLNRKQQVLIEETKSKESSVFSGAVQGSGLGPVICSDLYQRHDKRSKSKC